jgi:hypothetical protein
VRIAPDLKHLSRCVGCFLFTFLTLSLTGCGTSLPDGMVKINGTVTLDGSPLVCEGDGESYVNFMSDTNGGGSGSFDRTNGTFEMLLEPGDYTVVVRATDGFMQEDEKRGRIIPAKSLIPEKYTTGKTSDASVSVLPEGGSVVVPLVSE